MCKPQEGMSVDNSFDNCEIHPRSSTVLEHTPNVRFTTQNLTQTIDAASADIALEPPHSGDFHESFVVPDGSGDVAILIGDVTGHGAEAAVKAEEIRKEAVAQLQGGGSPLETITAANEVSQTSDERYSTLFVAKINAETSEITYANAGHDPAVVCDESGSANVLESTGPPLGVVSSVGDFYEQKTADFTPGSTLVVTTDGVPEARRAKEKPPKFFGYEKLVKLVVAFRRYSPSYIVQAVVTSVLNFTRSLLHDDVIVMAIRRRRKKEETK